MIKIILLIQLWLLKSECRLGGNGNGSNYNDVNRIKNEAVKPTPIFNNDKILDESKSASNLNDTSCDWHIFLHGSKLQKASRRCEIESPLIKKKYPHSHTFKYETYDATERAELYMLEKRYQPMANKYYLSILAMFKNEADIIEEWLDHHIYHGVEHFYLIDDYSTDDVMGRLEPYKAKGEKFICYNDIL